MPALLVNFGLGSMLTETDAREAFDRMTETVANLDQPSEAGRGILICGGGLRYFVCASVCINLLRYHNCQLPIQIWHLGAREMSEPMRRILVPLGVECVDADEVRKEHPVRILNGWELKPYAILHCPFREVLLLDADNVAVVDPTFLFETPQYREHGAIFWPDFNRLGRDRAIWRLTGVPYRDEPEFESGQIVVDKVRCWRALSLTVWMNEHSDFWYRYVHGDKETFHMAWRKLEQPYAMPSRGIYRLSGTMCQHDFEGRRIFQHRNLKKWTLGDNPRIPGFEFEDICLKFIDELRPHLRELRGFPKFDGELSAELAAHTVTYHRVGRDRRPMELKADGTIGLGQDRMERFWGMRREGEASVLEVYGDDGVTARLVPDPKDRTRWRGFWLIHERMPVEINIE